MQQPEPRRDSGKPELLDPCLDRFFQERDLRIDPPRRFVPSGDGKLQVFSGYSRRQENEARQREPPSASEDELSQAVKNFLIIRLNVDQAETTDGALPAEFHGILEDAERLLAACREQAGPGQFLKTYLKELIRTYSGVCGVTTVHPREVFVSQPSRSIPSEKSRMHISIETPVFKGAFLRPCIDSVFAQSSPSWTLSLVWDGGDEKSRKILEELEREGDPRVRVYFTENRGIAAARRFLTDRSHGAYILPLDDDDLLPVHAIERFLEEANERPWASLIRGRREFVGTDGAPIGKDSWFPFGPRSYFRGMVCDLFNQAQPYLIRRSAYLRTSGWTGFSDLLGAGEDCDLFLRLEEVAHFELVDEVLYHYRLHEGRASNFLTATAAFEMWRRLADSAIERMGLPLRRVNETVPFAYESLPRPEVTLNDVDFVLSPQNGPAAASLLRCSVEPDAIHLTGPGLPPGRWRMVGFRETRRPLVCFLDGQVDIEKRSCLETLVRHLESQEADLLAPPLRASGEAVACEYLLVRREVLAATGGFDECWVPASLQEIDLGIQARRRAFRCVEMPPAGLSFRGSITADRKAEDLPALESKWRSFASLLEAYGPPMHREAQWVRGRGEIAP